MNRQIIWSPHAENDYFKLLGFLLDRWGEKTAKTFNKRLDEVLGNISKSPNIYQSTGKFNNVRRCVVSKQVSLYYRNTETTIEIITLFDTRQHPKKLKVE